jgi:hypothetical protein
MSKLTDLLIEVTEKVPTDTKFGALMNMAVVIEREVKKLQALGISVTEESLISSLQQTLKEHIDFEEYEKKAKIA